MVIQVRVDFHVVFDWQDGETPVVILVCRELVLGIGLRSPGIISGNSHHAMIQAYFHEIAGMDVVDMCLFGFPVFRYKRVVGFVFREILPLVWAIGSFGVEVFYWVSGHVEFHEVRVGNEQESLSVFIRESQPTGFCFVAVFLWTYIWHVLLFGRTFVVPDECSVIPVTIVFLGSPSEILQLIHVCGSSETYPDSRKLGCIRSGF